LSMDREVWSSSRGLITDLDIMQKGDIMSGFIASLCSDGFSGYVYCVQSIVSHLSLQSDCNIVQKIGLDGSYFGESSTVWDSNSDKNEDPDCYIVNNEDFVGVFTGQLDEFDRETLYPERQGVIWHTPKRDERETSGFYPD